MLLSTKVIQKWNSKNKDRYVKLGYNFTKMKDEFEIDVCDLPDYSRAEIVVRCDYCGKEIHKQWINYVSETNRNMTGKDSCKNCQHIKAEETMLLKYDVKNPMYVDDFKNKQKETNVDRYGFENPSSNKMVRKKVAETNIKRYGGIAPTSSDLVKEKVATTCMSKYGVKSPLANWDRSGENNPNWNGGVSYNYEGRLSIECIDWRKKVYKKDNYTCQCCGSKNSKGNRVTINAHHIYNWSDYEELRYDVENGITLCDECHRKFHKIYGKRFNNKSQIEEFIHNNG